MSRSHIKKILREALGVPQNIVNVARKIFDDVLNVIPKEDSFEELNGFETKIKGSFEISDLKFKGVEFGIELVEHDELVLIGMATSEMSKLTSDYQIKRVKVKDSFNILFRFAAPKDTTGGELIEFIRNNRPEFIGSIAHELKHKYDSFKKPISSLPSRIRYSATSSRGFGNIHPINKFIHLMYYTHIVESLVRPSEIAALIDDGEINKKDFYKFVTSTRTYQTLLELRNFTYEKFKEDVKSELPKIKQLFDQNDIEYDNMTDDQIVERTLDLVYHNIKQWQGSEMMGKIVENPFEAILGFRGQKKIFFDNFVKKLERFGENYEKFFKYEIKMFNFVSEKMIRKIIKLYDLAK